MISVLVYIFYNIVFIIAYPIIAVIYFWHTLFNPRVKEGHLARLGFRKPKAAENDALWVHAVSVGEIIGVKGLIDRIKANTSLTIYLSTTTYTGYEMAKKFYGESVTLFYFPLDIPLLLASAFKRVKPRVVIVAEIEIWPNFIRAAKKRAIPLYLVNGRIGNKEYKGYKPLKIVLRPFYAMYTKALAQSAIDKTRMIDIGMPEEHIVVTGNLKYDVTYTLNNALSKEFEALIPKHKTVFVAGSTHAGEEDAILRAYTAMPDRESRFLVIAPRDIQRAGEIAERARNYGFMPHLRSEGKPRSRYDVLIVNTIGELLYLYKESDVIIMGGSFSKHVGGHNILEGIYFKKPVIVGPYMSNFSAMNELFTNAKGVYPIKSDKDLYRAMLTLFKDKKLRDAIGERAHQTFLENQGASDATYAIISENF